MRSWLRPSLRYGSVSTTPLARNALATAAASTSSEKSMVPTDLAAQRRIGDERGGVFAGVGPVVQALAGVGGTRDAPVEAAVTQHPVDLVAEQQQRRQRRGVVVWFLGCCVYRRWQRQELGHPPVGLGDLLDAFERLGLIRATRYRRRRRSISAGRSSRRRRRRRSPADRRHRRSRRWPPASPRTRPGAAPARPRRSTSRCGPSRSGRRRRSRRRSGRPGRGGARSVEITAGASRNGAFLDTVANLG